jgi:hypothetical protein
MVSIPKGLGFEKGYAGEGQQHIKKTDPDLSAEMAPHKIKIVTVKE